MPELNKFAAAIIHVLDRLPKGAYFSVGRKADEIEYIDVGYWAQVIVTDDGGEESPRNYGEGKTWRSAMCAAGLLDKPKCPDCDGVGWNPESDVNGEPVQAQCETCWGSGLLPDKEAAK